MVVIVDLLYSSSRLISLDEAPPVRNRGRMRPREFDGLASLMVSNQSAASQVDALYCCSVVD